MINKPKENTKSISVKSNYLTKANPFTLYNIISNDIIKIL